MSAPWWPEGRAEVPVSRRWVRVLWRLALLLPAALLLAVLLLPIGALLGTALGSFTAGLEHPLVGPALRVSLETSLVALGLSVALGTPLAWLLSRPASGPRAGLVRAVETLVQLPMVVPPAVAGIALLFAFGLHGVLGPTLAGAGWRVVFTTSAVVIAQIFVAAPFYVVSATEAFRRIDPRLLAAARGLGASPATAFVRVALPLASPGLVAGAAMCWARALGEFGATLMFAGNLEGRTQTLPLAIYTALEVDLRAARSLSIVLVVVAFALLLALRLTQRRAGAAHRQ